MGSGFLYPPSRAQAFVRRNKTGESPPSQSSPLKGEEVCGEGGCATEGRFFVAEPPQNDIWGRGGDGCQHTGGGFSAMGGWQWGKGEGRFQTCPYGAKEVMLVEGKGGSRTAPTGGGRMPGKEGTGGEGGWGMTEGWVPAYGRIQEGRDGSPHPRGQREGKGLGRWA